MKQKSKAKYILLLCIMSLLLAFVPRTSSLRLFTDQKDAKILDVQLETTGKTQSGQMKEMQNGLQSIEVKLPHKIEENSSLVVRSECEQVKAYYYWGIQFLKYYANSSISAYTQSTVEHPMNPDLEEDLSFVSAIQRYVASDYVLVLSVKGDARTGWDEESEQVLSDLGVQTTPWNGKDNDSWFAFISKDCVEAGSSSDRLYRAYNAGDHVLEVVSAGIYAGNESSILIDHKEYSANKNGLNLVVYDPEKDLVVDNLSYNMNTSAPVMSRNDEGLYTIYTTRINSAFLNRVHALETVASRCFCIVYILLAFLLYLLRCDLLHAETCIEKNKPVRMKERILRSLPLCLLFVLCGLLLVGFNYLKTHFANVTIAQLIFHMNTSLEGTNWKDFEELFKGLRNVAALALILYLILLFLEKTVLLRTTENEKAQVRVVAAHWLCVLLSLALLCNIVDSFWWKYSVYDYLVNNQFDAEVFDEYYVDPKSVEITFPEDKKNLIYIYMESMEISAADEAEGGGKSFNAIPELTKISFNNDSFAGDGLLNGAVPLTNCTWTIAGLVAQTSGLPLELENGFSNRKGSVQSFMPGATVLGDILEEEGYVNVFMLGSDAKFGNRKQYFSEHGNYEIDDYYWARMNEKFPYDYFVFWGYEDRKLFSYAKERAEELAADEKPFNLTLLTVDTHFTDGYLCEECPDTYPQQYSNVLSCSDHQVAEFVKWVQQQPWGKDTVIVLAGDHLCMDSVYYSDMPEEYERKSYFTILNSTKEEPKVRREYATIDAFPTTLSALGAEIEGDRLGLGTDLYSDRKSLLEEKGREYLENQFAMNSKYYKENILYK